MLEVTLVNPYYFTWNMLIGHNINVKISYLKPITIDKTIIIHGAFSSQAFEFLIYSFNICFCLRCLGYSVNQKYVMYLRNVRNLLIYLRMYLCNLSEM